ncbi:glycoside hydrolase [Candidatus Saccharibacteria bacterium]|nr:glycoside hydrolase [Candidatus Saccharibacteria bacterium]
MKNSLFALLAFLAIVNSAFFIASHVVTNTYQAPPITHIDFVQAELDSMTLDEKIAQMLVVERTSPTFSPDEAAKLQTAPYGGYILMGQSYSTLAGTRTLVETLQSTAKTPLIITTDEEGGLVQRLKSITDLQPTDIPDMYSVGETGDLDYAQAIGKILAEELRTVGVNVDMAPDADVFSNPNNPVIGRRSFSSDSNVVATMSEALAEGLEQNGVIATFKHFPGHGDTDTDSHQSLPIINRAREELAQSDLIPFKNAIKNGAQFIMVGHIALPKITSDTTPATLSPIITTDLLRHELGYDNLIITDALNMGAITDNYTEADSYIKAVQAGADLLLMPPTPELAEQTIKANIPESQINESVYRILRFKQNYLNDYQYLDPSYFTTPIINEH